MRAGNILRILVISFALSAYSAWGLAQREARFPETRASPPSRIPLVRRGEAEALWRDPATLFLDVRPPGDYEIGHIAGAVSFPEEDFEKLYPTLQPRLQRAKTLVVYCKSLDCGKSLWTAIRLRNEGLTQTKIYPAGWNEWYLGGLPRAGTGQ